MARLLVLGFTISADGYGAGLDLPALGYAVRKSIPSEKAVHYIIART